MPIPVTFDVDAHDEENAQRFEAAAEVLRGAEAAYRARAEAATKRCDLDTAFGLIRLANERATRAHAFIDAAKMLREDIARRARCGTVAA
jgi:hypothetical protein